MIFPYPVEFKDTQKFPLTWTLLGLNLIIFIIIFSGASSSLSNASLLRGEELTQSGRLYLQYLETQSPEVLASKPQWIRDLDLNDTSQLGLLGAYALRDGLFLRAAPGFIFNGDAVEIQKWKASLEDFQRKQKDQILNRFGLSGLEAKPLAWITYQFSHSSWMHLLSNGIFLLLLGVAIESLAGSGALVLTYILGGLAGAAGFILSDPTGTVPMVGASGSVSAMLAFYCFCETRARVRYLYVLSPLPGHYGFIYLPVLLIVPLYLVSDLASLWSSPEGFGGGVAYSAHLAGAFMGAGLGLVYRLYGSFSRSPSTL